MFSFMGFIFESVNTLDDAMRIFGINEFPKTKSELNQIYKKLSVQYHPDLGGSEEKMKDLNQARDILLSKYPKSGVASSPVIRDAAYWDRFFKERKEQDEKTLKSIRLNMDSNVNPKIFSDYFGKIFGEEFTAKYSSKVTETYYIGEMHISNKSGSVTCDLEIWVYVVQGNTRDVHDLGAEHGITYNVQLVPIIIANRKKYKLTRKDWTIKRDFNMFIDPEVIFPRKRMETIAKSVKTTTIGKETPLKPADLKAIIEKKYDGRYVKSSSSVHLYDVPLGVIRDQKGRDILARIVFSRTTMYGMSVFRLSDVYGTLVDEKYPIPVREKYPLSLKYLIGMTYDKLEFIENLIAKARKKHTLKEITDIANEEIEKAYQKEQKKYQKG